MYFVFSLIEIFDRDFFLAHLCADKFFGSFALHSLVEITRHQRSTISNHLSHGDSQLRTHDRLFSPINQYFSHSIFV